MKSRKNKRLKLFIIYISVIILLGLVSFGGYEFYDKVYLEKISKINIKLNGKQNIELELEQEYVEEGAKAKFRKKDITKDIKIKGEVDNKKIGKYKITYTVSFKNGNREYLKPFILIYENGVWKISSAYYHDICELDYYIE